MQDEIAELNQIIFDSLDKIKYVDSMHIPDYMFKYSSLGYCNNISFGGTQFWCSENDEREVNDETGEYEPIVPFLKRKLSDHIFLLENIRDELFTLE